MVELDSGIISREAPIASPVLVALTLQGLDLLSEGLSDAPTKDPPPQDA